MKTRIAIILIIIAEIFSALLVGTIMIPSESCGLKTFSTPSHFTPSLMTAFVLLLITACILWRKTTKTAWFSCLIIAIVNIGIMCWSAVYYLSTHCDGIYEMPSNTELAKLSIIAAAIMTSSLPLLFWDIKRIIRKPSVGNAENKSHSSFPIIIFILVIFIPFIMMLMHSCVGGVFCTCRRCAYDVTRNEIRNAVNAYMADSNNPSQLPIINESATFTSTHPNGSYYIINISALLVNNGVSLRAVPDSCIQIPGPDNDNCDGGAFGCSNSSHYVWGVDNLGNIASKSVNINTSDELECNACDYCQCDTCDGYQDIYP